MMLLPTYLTVYHSWGSSMTPRGWIAKTACWVPSQIVVFCLPWSLKYHLARIFWYHLLRKNFATGTSCDVQVNTEQKNCPVSIYGKDAILAGLCSSWLCLSWLGKMAKSLFNISFHFFYFLINECMRGKWLIGKHRIKGRVRVTLHV